MKIVTVVGNRPQFIKSAPLSVALREGGIEEVVVHTGQHYDRALSQVFFEELAIPEPRHNLDLHTAKPEVMEPVIAATVKDEFPDLVRGHELDARGRARERVRGGTRGARRGGSAKR